jgi:Uncharacterized conserved protein
MTEKRSRFIGTVRLATTVPGAREAIRSVGALRPDANHHCWAYRVGLPPSEYYSDAGEPSGTAGKPILGAIQRAGHDQHGRRGHPLLRRNQTGGPRTHRGLRGCGQEGSRGRGFLPEGCHSDRASPSPLRGTGKPALFPEGSRSGCGILNLPLRRKGYHGGARSPFQGGPRKGPFRIPPCPGTASRVGMALRSRRKLRRRCQRRGQ